MKEPCFKGEQAFLPVESRGKQPQLGDRPSREVGACRTHLPPKGGQLKKKKVTFFRDKRKNMGCSEVIVS